MQTPCAARYCVAKKKPVILTARLVKIIIRELLVVGTGIKNVCYVFENRMKTGERRDK